MNNLMEVWIAELRSGEYTQGTEKLKSYQDEYCCLGVLCNIVSPGEWDSGQEGYSFLGNEGDPPYEVVLQLGVNVEDVPGFISDLVNKNDTLCYTFSEIADFLETGKEVEHFA